MAKLKFAIFLSFIFLVYCVSGREVLQLSEFINFEILCKANVTGVSESCQNQLNESCTHAVLLETMLDATSKFPYTGLNTSTKRDYGNYDQCMTIDHIYDKGRILGKHCLFGLTVILDPKDIYSLSVCMPDKCTDDDYNLLVQSVKTDVPFPLRFNTKQCSTKEFYGDISPLGIITILIFAICIMLMVICTVYDLYLKRCNKKPAHVLYLSFSVYTNGRKLIQTTKRAKEQILLFHGLKIISMCWVITGHGSSIWQFLSLSNQNDLDEIQTRMESFYLRGGLLGVDTFFYLSGFLFAWSYVKKKSMSLKGHIMDVPKAYIHRYLRLSPAFFILYLVQISIYSHLGSGPYWRYFSTQIEEKCKKHWWPLMLYIQNYYNTDEVCLVHSWYLSADMQLFIIAPIVVIPLALALRNPKKLKLTMFGMCLLNILLAALTVIIKLQFRDYKNNYDTHSRLHVYFIGVMMGAFLQETKDLSFLPFLSKFGKKILQLVNLLMWIITLTLMFAVIITQTIVDLHAGYEATAYFDAFKRIVWVAGLSWIVYSSYHGYGGFVNWLLSRPLLQIGGKLSYCIYLIHGVVIMYNTMVVRTRLYASHYDWFYTWCGHFIFSTFIAIFWTLAFESPLITVERFIFGGAGKKPKKQANKPQVQNQQEKLQGISEPHQNGTLNKEILKSDDVTVTIKTEPKTE